MSPKFHKQVEDYWSVVRDSLIWSLGAIMELNDEVIEDIIKNEKKSHTSTRYVIGGKIEGLEGNLNDDFVNFPRIELTENNITSVKDKKGKVSLKFKPTIKFHGDKQVRLQPNYSELWAE